MKAFVTEAAAAGIDLFRVFDSLKSVPNMELSLEAVREAGALCEASICYTGDILDPKRTKYDLKYYVDMAKELEKRGANLIGHQGYGFGLCKPLAAERLIKALRDEVGVPIHFHTHDIGGRAGGQCVERALTSASTLPMKPSPSMAWLNVAAGA